MGGTTAIACTRVPRRPGLPPHPRNWRNAQAMLIDRLLAGGGCNYGNTVVLGQELRPHVQPWPGDARLGGTNQRRSPHCTLARFFRPRIFRRRLTVGVVGLWIDGPRGDDSIFHPTPAIGCGPRIGGRSPAMARFTNWRCSVWRRSWARPVRWSRCRRKVRVARDERRGTQESIHFDGTIR